MATKKQIANALQKTAGNVALAARELKCSRSTIYRKIEQFPDLGEILEDAREELVDIAESKLRQQVMNGNMTAIIFTLKTQGKQRGYVERQEIVGDINIKNKGYVGFTPDEWDDKSR